MGCNFTFITYLNLCNFSFSFRISIFAEMIHIINLIIINLYEVYFHKKDLNNIFFTRNISSHIKLSN